LTLVG